MRLYRSLQKCLRWIQQEGPHADKHAGWAHPIAAFAVHYLVVAVIMLAAHDISLYGRPLISSSRYDIALPPHRLWTAHFLLAYSAWLLGCRIWINATTKSKRTFRYAVFYEYTFLCNVTLFLSSLAIYARRPIIATSFCIAVGIDQILWYADLAVYVIW